MKLIYSSEEKQIIKTLNMYSRNYNSNKCFAKIKTRQYNNRVTR